MKRKTWTSLETKDFAYLELEDQSRGHARAAGWAWDLRSTAAMPAYRNVAWAHEAGDRHALDRERLGTGQTCLYRQHFVTQGS